MLGTAAAAEKRALVCQPLYTLSKLTVLREIPFLEYKDILPKSLPSKKGRAFRSFGPNCQSSLFHPRAC